MATNTWYHIAVVRSGTGANQTIMYINGVNVASGTCAHSVAANQVVVGGIDWAASYSTKGYIASFRYSNSARTIIVPTVPYSSDANTLVLTCQSNRFVELSASRTITIAETPRAIAFSPFAPTAVYSPVVHGGSGYFDGSGDVLVPTANNAFAFGTGPFCIEAWIYNNVLKNYSCLVTTRPNNGSYADAYHIGWDSVGGVSLYINTTSSPAGPSGTMKLNVWQHFVCCRDSNNITSIFVDGVRVGTATITSNFTRNLLGIGDFPTTQAEGHNGYISNLRLVKGNSVYNPTQTTITVPTAPVTAVTNTSLLLNFTDAAILDRTGRTVVETVADAKSSSVQVKYGNGAMSFDGTGDYLQIPYQSLSADFGTGPFTIELWVYFSSSVSTTQMFVSSNYNATTGAGGWAFLRRGDNATIKFTQGSNISYEKSWSPSLSTWYHCAVTRDLSNNLRIFVDGTQVGSTDASVTASINGSTSLLIGTNQTTPFPITGYIDDLRITKFARYTANFTPPTAAHRLK